MIFRVDGNWSDHAIKFANRRQCVAQFSSIGRERPLGSFNVRVLSQVCDQINDLISSVAAVEIAFSLVTIPAFFSSSIAFAVTGAKLVGTIIPSARSGQP